MSTTERDVEGWLFSMSIWGYALTGAYDRLASTFEQTYDHDGAWWDHPGPVRNATFNGEPVPLWWALRGAQGRQDFHDEWRAKRGD